MEQYANIDNTMERENMPLQDVRLQQNLGEMPWGETTAPWNSAAPQMNMGQQGGEAFISPSSINPTPQEVNELQRRMANMEQYIVDNQARTLQERLSNLLGRYVVCEFLVGTQVMYTRSGIMTQIGRDYFILYDPYEQNFVGCDAYALKFITIFPEGQRPGPMNEEEQMEYLEKLKQNQRNRIVYAPGVETQNAVGADNRIPVMMLSEDQSYMG